MGEYQKSGVMASLDGGTDSVSDNFSFDSDFYLCMHECLINTVYGLWSLTR